jgi:4-hydroxybenzoyl-CoA thioesterase
MLVHRRNFRIEWSQCDPAGIVFYPQYFILFDAAAGQLFERTGLSASGIRKRYGIVGFPLVEAGAKFLAPCRFDDEVALETFVRE